MKKNILLTIAIPTFNRFGNLKLQLLKIHSILSRVHEANTIELLVSDNCSTDSTQRVLEKISILPKKYHFTYVKNTSNVGSDMNFMASLLNSSGKFVWIFSDDDKLENHSIEYMRGIVLENQDFGFGVINFYKNPQKTTTSFSNGDDYFISEDINLLMPQLLKSGMLSSCVFKRRLLSKKNMIGYIDSAPGYPHMFWGLDIAQKYKTLVVNRPLFTVIEPSVEERREGALKRENCYFDFYLNAHLSWLKYVCRLRGSKLSIWNAFKLHKISINENLNQILFHKITNKKYDLLAIRSSITVMSRCFYYSLSFWLLHLPILLLPSFVAKSIEPYRWRYIDFRGKVKKKIERLFDK